MLTQQNYHLKRIPFIPIITDMLDCISGYIFFTKLDISMQYYIFELDELSQELHVIVTPFGKYKYKCLSMGLKCAPDFAQQVMEEVLPIIKDTSIYLDDIDAFSFTWEHHILLLDKILNWLEANGFTINPLKCKQAIQETDWLSNWLTPTGLKLWCKKLMANNKCINQKTYCKYVAFSVLSIITGTCGLRAHTSWHLSPVSPERQHFAGLQK